MKKKIYTRTSTNKSEIYKAKPDKEIKKIYIYMELQKRFIKRR